MSLWVLRGLRDGVVTTRWPTQSGPLRGRWRGPAVVHASVRPTTAGREALCPTQARSRTSSPSRDVRVDQGLCILCGLASPPAPTSSAGPRARTVPATAALTRDQLIVPEVPETDEAIDAVRARLRERTAALRRSVHIRHVDAGRTAATSGRSRPCSVPSTTFTGSGCFFTASPRHADVLLVTGAGPRGMAGPLRTTYDAMPDPKIVIATGTDAVSGGLLGQQRQLPSAESPPRFRSTSGWPARRPARSEFSTRC